ncbi:hypothetical protein DFH08DRAFT_813327 [Mycena albidolilacea]|uniref:CFEM domain-containing protein n=1 Tax=Mycena albidolilacea TaxID=1033008 RepID=A0AAD7ELF8_9AGAR|nr:hypothetical protein DFH08DRAFT_813327 [Mycena albidolilacea]
MHIDVLQAAEKAGSAAWVGQEAACTVRQVPRKQGAKWGPGTSSRMTSGVGGAQIDSDGKMTCTNKSAQKTGKHAEQNSDGGHSTTARVFNRPHQCQKNRPICYHQHQKCQANRSCSNRQMARLELWIYSAIYLATSGYGSGSAAGSAAKPSGTTRLTPCVINCLAAAANATECGTLTNLTCACTNANFQFKAHSCLQAKCKPEDVAAW